MIKPFSVTLSVDPALIVMLFAPLATVIPEKP